MADDTSDEQEEQSEETTGDEPDVQDEPDLGGDDYVEIDPEQAEAVAEETSSGDEDDSSSADASSESTDDGDGGSMDLSSMDHSPGRIYTNALGMGAVVARDRYGSGISGDRTDEMEEYSEMARQLEIDAAVDEWLKQKGGLDELSPGQAVVVGTMMFGAFVAVEDPELVENMAEGVEA